MSSLRDAAVELAAALESEDAGERLGKLPAYSYPPVDITLPCIVLEPADDYIGGEEDRTLGGEFSIAQDVYLLLEFNDPDQATTDLDALLEHFLTNLPAGWGIDSMRKPGPLHTADWLAYGLPITVSRFINL